MFILFFRHIKALVDNSSVKAAEKDIAAMCGRRRTVLVKAFSYWGEPKPRQPSHIYDLRSYVLKVGYPNLLRSFYN